MKTLKTIKGRWRNWMNDKDDEIYSYVLEYENTRHGDYRAKTVLYKRGVVLITFDSKPYKSLHALEKYIEKLHSTMKSVWFIE